MRPTISAPFADANSRGNCEHSQQWQRKQNDKTHPDIGLQVMELWGFVHQNGELECATEKVFKREIKGRRVLRHVVGRIKNPGNEDGMERGCERVADGYFLSRRSIFTHFGGTGERSSDPPQILLTWTSQKDATFGYSLRSVVMGRPCPKPPPQIPCTRVSWILCIGVIKWEGHSTPRLCNLLKNK